MTLNVSEMAKDTAIVTISNYIVTISNYGIWRANRKPYLSFQMVPFSMILTDPHFKVTIMFNIK